MKPLWQHRLHRCARALGWTAGVLVILLAVLMALTQLLLPQLARHPAWVAAQLSQRLQRPVSFSALEGRWTPSGPLFVLHDVTVGATGTSGSALRLPEAELKLDFGGWLLPSGHLLNVHVRGLQLELARDASGHWQINGVGLGGGGSPSAMPLGRLSLGLWLDDLRVVVSDATLGKRLTLQSPQLRLSLGGGRLRFAGALRRLGETAALRTAGRFALDGSAGRVWVGVDGVDLKPLLAGIDLHGYTAVEGHGRAAAWLNWHHGRVNNSVIRYDVDRLTLRAPDGASASVAALRGLAGLRRTGDGYAIRWAGDDGSVLALNLHRPGSAQASAGIAARQLQLAPLLPWLALKPALAPTLAQWLGSGHPHGELTRLALHWSAAGGVQAIELAFRNMGIDPVGKLPGFSGLRGLLRGDPEAYSLELPAQATTLQFPQLFRQPLVLSKVAGTLAFWQADGDWRLGADPLDFVGAGYAGQLRGKASLPAGGGKPVLDLYASLTQGEVAAAKLFWPLGAMSPGTIGWLDHALVSGQLDQAQVLLRGDLADWPFRHNEGRFEARAVISDLTLDYGKDWPRVEGVDAVASFVNNGMLIEASDGQSLGVKADKAVALIPDFADGLLDLNVQGSGSGASLMNFVRNSPIGRRQADTLAKLSLGGSGSFDFHLSLPLKHAQDLQLSGSAQLKGADLSAPAWNLQLDQLSGPLQFDAHGMLAGPLTGGFRGQPSRLQLALGAATGDPASVLSAQLRGNYAFADLVQGYPSLQWLGQTADGRSPFMVGFSIAHVPGSDALAQTLTIDSALDGIALTLPAPLNKPAAANLPLHLALGLPVNGSDLQFGLGQLLRGHLQLPDGAQHPLRGTLALGSEMPQTLPPQGLRFRGHADQLDITGWVQHVVAGSGSGGPTLESLDLSAAHSQWFGHPLGAITVRAIPQPGMLNIDVNGPAMAGSFSVPTQEMDKRGITARLQRLYWPKDATVSKTPAPAAPANAAVDNPADTGINPQALPPLHLWVSDLRLGDAKLGDARLETWPTARGLHIDQLRALSSHVQITGSGDWDGNASDSHTQMRIEFAAENLGDMLSALGYEGLFDGGKTHDRLDARWPGAPSALALANMDGKLSVNVSNGRIPEVPAGVGRLFGLVSVAELPRRLTLDFGDVFGKGLAFDSIKGDFRLADGNATTDNLVILGPAANISISGRTGLRSHDYDQQVRVVPHIGNSLPLVGAVVGGPIGAAAGFAMQGLLGHGLNQAAAARYKVTGSWDKPVMTLIEKHGLPAAPLPLTVPYKPGHLPAAGGRVAPAPAASAGRSRGAL